PEAVLTATGNWVAVNPQTAATSAAGGPRAPRASAERRRTVMDFKLDIADSGELLKRFGMGELIRRGKGKLEGQVAWIGSPLSLDYPTLSGQFNVNVESGQFVKADPGIAKLLGVLSLQSLPRRLTLDFRDVFSEGFAFDFVRGDVNISQGLAHTNNLQMRGVNAAVLMEGSADIARETQNIKVVVVPEINAGTASLIATAINPAIGLGSFLAQMFLRRPLMQAATQEFHIDGTWADPKITKLDRKARAEGKAGDTSTETR
ncbi:MAG: YhdP family protein, partial [Lysobacterales bacterium]